MVVVLSLAILVLIVSNVVLWGYQMNQFDLERMQESVSVLNVAREVRSSWFTVQSEYTVNIGSRTSGTYEDTQAVDDSYEAFREDVATFSCNPSSFTLGGSTGWVSGEFSDLVSDDGAYMVFRSYASGSLSNTKAFVSYRSKSGSGANYPKYREYDGDVWDTSESELFSAGSPVRHVRVAYCPKSDRYMERIVVTLSNDGYLDAYVWDGTTWTTYNNLGRVWVSAPSDPRRPFDIAYEKESGRALLVYGNTETNGTRDLSYRIWDGNSWGEEKYIDDVGHSGHITVSYVNLATKTTDGANEIGLIYIDGTNSDAVAMIWDGNSWRDQQEITSSVSTYRYEAVAIAYEQQSGHLMAVAGQGSLIAWSRYTTDWSIPSTFDINSHATSSMYWLVLKADPSSNRLMLLSLYRTSDACACDWTGSEWETALRLDSKLETWSTRALDGDWEPSGSKFIAVAGDRNVDAISYKTWTPESGWNPSTPDVWTQYSGLTTYQRWVQVRRDPRGVGSAKLWIATLDDGSDLVLTKWNGSTMGDQIEVTNNVGTTAYESFEVEFQIATSGIREYRCEVELAGSSDTNDWAQLVWTVGSAWTTDSVNVTIQLYNYTAGAYATSGNGYVNYISSGTPNTDETKSKTVTVNPTDFKNSTGHWKMRITGLKEAAAPFDLKIDLIEFKPKGQRLEIEGVYTLDTATYPLEDILTVEIQLRIRADDSLEECILKAYNWTSGNYDNTGFNATSSWSLTTEWNSYAVNLTNVWSSYVQSNGTVKLKLYDGGADSVQTTISIDFLAVRLVVQGATFN